MVLCFDNAVVDHHGLVNFGLTQNVHLVRKERLVPYLWIDRFSFLILILIDRQARIHVHGEPLVSVRNQLFKILVVLICGFVLVFNFERRILGHSLWEVGYKIPLSIACASVAHKEHVTALVFFCGRGKARDELLCVDIFEGASVEGWLIV